MPNDAFDMSSAAPRKTCGLVMPISNQPGCAAEHWADVRSIIEEAVQLIEEPKFDVKLVSDADDVGVIQKRIVQNVYSSDILVCDVSCKNANVMFELGLRLAFDKPTVIVKDDMTDYSFDTGIIEHLTYPRDLRFTKITQFKKFLSEKVAATYKASLDPAHSTFLKNFGTFRVAALAENIASSDRITLEMFTEIQAEIALLRRDVRRSLPPPLRRPIAESDNDEKASVAKGMLLSLITDYMKSNNIKDVKTLRQDIEFGRWLLKNFPANKYFDSTHEFQRAIDESMEFYEMLR